MAALKGANLLRVKGIVNVAGSPVVVHVVQSVIHEPVVLESWPSADRSTRIVFITRGMARELIPFGIRVNAVAPGVITTPFQERYSTKAQLDAMLATIPQGRLGTAEDCIGAYLFLASESLSGYVIGHVLEVNGGQLMP